MKEINHEIERPLLYKGLLASLLNYVIVLLGTLLLFYAVCYPVYTQNTDYHEASTYLNDLKERDNLNLNDRQSYDVYQQALRQIYFVTYPDEIVTYENDFNNESHSIYYYYNTLVCELPTSPTPSNYSTNYFSYVTKEDGSINVDVECQMNDSLSEKGYEDVRDIFYSSYHHLLDLISGFDEKLSTSRSYIFTVERDARLASYGMSCLLYWLLCPLLSKHGALLGEKIFGIAYTKTNGYIAKPWRFVLKNALQIPLPSILMIFFSPYSVALALIAPWFLSMMVYLLFSKNHQSIPELIAGIIEVDSLRTDFYHDALEKADFENRALGEFQEPDYTVKLSNTETLDVKDKKED
jgi:hypothetical protein